MTSTNFNVGLGEAAKSSSKVLKPPGGGTSDIFGASEGGVEQSPRRIRATNHLQSSVFAANETSEPPVTPRNKPGGNPVTGEGYSATNGEKEGSSSPPAATTTTSADIRRSRVPPGGFSSGLW